MPQSDDETRRIINAAELTRLRRMYPDLDGWSARSKQLESPESGSDMASDIAASHGMGVPFVNLVRHQLISATQHLNLAPTSVEARQVFPLAHPTVLRGALLGAARGVWLLHPTDSGVRQARAARVALDMHRRLLEWVDEPENELGDDARGDTKDVVTDIVADLSVRDDVRQLRIYDTETIREAGQIVFSDPHQAGAVVALWRQLSGDAHSLVWPGVTRANTQRVRASRDPRFPLPMVEMTSGGDIRELVNGFSAAFRILKVGWSLFDQRCTAS